MAQVKLSHNPYLNKTVIDIDGEVVTGGPLHELVYSKRLQVWLEDIFPQLVEHCNCHQIGLSFHGIVADYTDLEQTAREYSARNNIEIHMTHAAGGESDPDRKITELRKLFAEAKKGPIEEFHSEELERDFEKALSREYEVSVIATMSAGKSTLINAMLGEDLLPAKNEACTATVTFISDDDEMDHFVGRAYDDNGKPLTDSVRVTPELMAEWNRENVNRVELRGNIPMIRNSENVRLIIADTPGPNNSRNFKHQSCTMGMIKNEQKPMILYVLNATQLSTNDDAVLLRTVAAEMSRGGKQAHDRFIFAVNKIDQFDPEKESVSNALAKVRTYLEEHGIHNPNIFPVSALVTKLVREKRKGYGLSRLETNDLRGGIELFNEEPDMHLLKYTSVSPSVKRNILRRIAEAERKNDKEELAMIHSGVPIIEESIEEYLKKYALPAKICLAKESFADILERRETLARIDEELRKNAAERETVYAQMLTIKKRIEKGAEAKSFRERLAKVLWIKTTEYDLRVRPLETSVNKRIAEFQTSLGSEEVSPLVAQNLLCSIERDASFVVSEVQQELEKAVKEDVISIMDRIREDYQKYVSELLGDDGSMSLAMKEFRTAAIMFPSAASLVRKYAETRSVVTGHHYVSDSTWWKPWSWGRKKKVNEYENREYVNIREVGNELADLLRANFFANLEQAENLAKDMVAGMRNDFLGRMNDLDRKVAQMVNEMAEKTASTEDLERVIRENENKREWHNDFQRRLDCVLSVDGMC